MQFIEFCSFIKFKPRYTEQPGQPCQCRLADAHLFELEKINQKGHVQDEYKKEGRTSYNPLN